MARATDKWERENPNWEDEVEELTEEQQKQVSKILYTLGREEKNLSSLRKHIESNPMDYIRHIRNSKKKRGME